MKQLITLIGIVSILSLSSCSKETVTQQQYYQKCTSYEMVLNNSLTIYATTYKFIGNDKYEVTTLVFNQNNIVTGTTVNTYNRILFTEIRTKLNCYNSLIP